MSFSSFLFIHWLIDLFVNGSISLVCPYVASLVVGKGQNKGLRKHSHVDVTYRLLVEFTLKIDYSKQKSKEDQKSIHQGL